MSYDELIAVLFGADPFDDACMRLDVALRAIWLLYRRGKWKLLAEMGVSRKEFERLFETFDLAFILTDRGRLRDESQAASLLRFVYQANNARGVILLSACLWMVSEYYATKIDPLRRRH